jgi:hypothetical protein
MSEHMRSEQPGLAEAGPADMRRAQKVARALELRGLGMSYRAIAEALGWRSPATAYGVVQRAMRKLVREAAAEAVALEADRLDNYLRALAPRALAGDLEALDRAIRISESRRKLLGLDAPQKIAPTSPSGEEEYGTAAELYRLRRLADILGRGEQTPGAGAPDRAAGGAGDGSSERPGVDSDQSLHQG